MDSLPRREKSKLPAIAFSAAAGAVCGILLSRNFFETEKKIRHLVTTDFGVEDPPFVRTLSDLLGPPLLPGNEVVILQNGAQLFQPSRYHCKYMTVDDCSVSAGSANFDSRSFRLNDEANLNLRGRDFAAQHVGIFEKDKSVSDEIIRARWKWRPCRDRGIGRTAGLLRSQM